MKDQKLFKKRKRRYWVKHKVGDLEVAINCTKIVLNDEESLTLDERNLECHIDYTEVGGVEGIVFHEENEETKLVEVKILQGSQALDIDVFFTMIGSILECELRYSTDEEMLMYTEQKYFPRGESVYGGLGSLFRNERSLTMITRTLLVNSVSRKKHLYLSRWSTYPLIQISKEKTFILAVAEAVDEGDDS